MRSRGHGAAGGAAGGRGGRRAGEGWGRLGPRGEWEVPGGRGVFSWGGVERLQPVAGPRWHRRVEWSAAAGGAAAAFADVAGTAGAHLGTAGEAERSVDRGTGDEFEHLGGG